MSLIKKISAGILITSAFISSYATELTKPEVIDAMKKSADYHLQNTTPTSPSGGKIKELLVRLWENAAFFDGLVELTKVTGEPKYWAEVLRLGDSVNWTANPRWTKKFGFHADDHAVGHAWLDTYLADPSKTEILEPFKKGMLANIALANKIRSSGKMPKAKEPRMRHGAHVVETWTWADALFMAPPTVARLYEITGDKVFLDYLNQEFKFSYDYLYSKEDSLFYRDASYIGKKSPAGKKVFWGRGNGWVVGGLVQVLRHLPDDEPTKKFYKDLFVEMMEKIASIQNEQGLWTVNLDDQNQYKGGEVSASGFMVYGIAWGINKGYLDREKYLPLAEKGWRGLLNCVDEKGMVGFVQPVGAAPGGFTAKSSQSYGIGVFLLAGTEIARALDMQTKESPKEIYENVVKAAQSKELKAIVRYEPRRKDDIAFENDKMAFRVYGPALKNSIENSGIDIWAKSVNYPITKKWYDLKFSKGLSYHKDNGEGLDAYKVADSVGLGGTGIWKDGKLYKSNVYVNYDIYLQPNNSAKFILVYNYNVDGEKYTEFKMITLKVGDDTCKVESRFTKGHQLFPSTTYPARMKGIEGLSVATGIYLQNPKAKFTTENGTISVKDKLAGKSLNQFIKINSDVEKFEVVPFKKSKEILGIMKTDKSGVVKYEFGYTWGK